VVLSDLSIRRPVFATVLSLLLVVLGVIAYTRLTLRELPAIDPPIVSVFVEYPGASAAVVETRITQVLEDALSGIEGVETIESQSSNGEGSISIEFSIDRDIEAAANDVRDAVSRVVDRMPEEADPPEIEKAESDADVILWLNMSSTRMDTLELTDYADRYVVDRLSSLDGVSRVRVAGGQRYAMRVWLDSAALAARGLTVADVEDALERENVELPAGSIESSERDFTLRVQRGYRDPADFAKLTLAKGAEGYLVRLGDVARVERASEERRAYFRSNGVENVGLGIVKTSTANSLDVARAARKTAEEIQKSLPEGTRIFVAFDSTVFIDAAVERVFETLFEAIALVIVVIYLFLGNAPLGADPAVTIPVCLVTAFAALWAFGFTINLLTLLAIVLCIGLVVDDAIVVVENIQRRVDAREPPLVARSAWHRAGRLRRDRDDDRAGRRVPAGRLHGGQHGPLFRELAVALAGAVAISCFVALSLTPMMSSKLIRPHTQPRGLNAWIHAQLTRLSAAYRRQVAATIGRPAIFGAILLGSALLSFLLFDFVPKELAPGEDRGAFFITVEAPEGAGYDYTVAQIKKVEQLLVPLTGTDKPIQRVNTRVPGFFGASEDMNSGQAIIFLQDWNHRDVTTAQVVESLRSQLAAIPSVRATPFVRTGLLRSNSRPLQIVLGGPDYQEIAGWRDRMLARMAENPGILDADSDYKETRPQLRIEINFERAADLGVSTEEIGTTLETMMGSRRVTTFVENGEEYDVVLQARPRAAPRPPTSRTSTCARRGAVELVPLSALVTLSEVAEPGTLNRFNRLRAITISASLASGYTLGEAIDWMRKTASEELPEIAQIDYKGQSREFVNAGGAVFFTFTMALLIVYLVLAAQFESFVHPFVIMLTVPLAVTGALLGLWFSERP
jgi:multidrug efflux pump